MADPTPAPPPPRVRLPRGAKRGSARGRPALHVGRAGGGPLCGRIAVLL